jgi:hypothetical protein
MDIMLAGELLDDFIDAMEKTDKEKAVVIYS